MGSEENITEKAQREMGIEECVGFPWVAVGRGTQEGTLPVGGRAQAKTRKGGISPRVDVGNSN